MLCKARGDVPGDVPRLFPGRLGDGSGKAGESSDFFGSLRNLSRCVSEPPGHHAEPRRCGGASTEAADRLKRASVAIIACAQRLHGVPGWLGKVLVKFRRIGRESYERHKVNPGRHRSSVADEHRSHDHEHLFCSLFILHTAHLRGALPRRRRLYARTGKVIVLFHAHEHAPCAPRAPCTLHSSQ